MAATRKAPQDHRKPADDDSDFEFKHDGQTYALPKFGKWKSNLVRRIRKLSDVDALYTILETVCEPGSGYEDALDALDDMPMQAFGDTMQDWQDHAGVSLGESQRSAS